MYVGGMLLPGRARRVDAVAPRLDGVAPVDDPVADHGEVPQPVELVPPDVLGEGGPADPAARDGEEGLPLLVAGPGVEVDVSRVGEATGRGQILALGGNGQVAAWDKWNY